MSGAKERRSPVILSGSEESLTLRFCRERVPGSTRSLLQYAFSGRVILRYRSSENSGLGVQGSSSAGGMGVSAMLLSHHRGLGAWPSPAGGMGEAPNVP